MGLWFKELLPVLLARALMDHIQRLLFLLASYLGCEQVYFG
jgi:hypothetical protein